MMTFETNVDAQRSMLKISFLQHFMIIYFIFFKKSMGMDDFVLCFSVVLLYIFFEILSTYMISGYFEENLIL